MELSNNTPSMNNIYDSTYFTSVKNDEQERSNKMYSMGENPYSTGIVNLPAYSDMFKRNHNDNDNDNDNDNSSREYITSLSGNKIDKNVFIHNNMTPFLRKNVTQNTNLENMSPFLDNKTGNNQYWQTKKEVPCMFKPEINTGGNICGMKNNDDFYKSRIDINYKANNFFPIEQINVGPGINKGYDYKGTGGFHQQDTNNFAKPRTLDELRSKINQKETYFQIPVKGHLKGTDQRGIQMPLNKNKPDKVYEQTEDMWLKTTGSINKETLRASQNIRPTTRQNTHIDYKGQVSLQDKNNGVNDDYGKSKIITYNNERATTENKPVVSNVSSLVKAIAAPILDALKYSMKEYTVESERGVGNPSIQIPEKATLYDPVNHIMKTTLKETTIHDSELTNLTGNKETYSNITDQAKTTIKETTIHDSELTNLTGNKETYSTITDQAKTTIKETIIHDGVINNLRGKDGGYIKTDNEAKKTIRETIKNIDTIRNIGGVSYKVTVYDPDIVAKTTIKETTLVPKSQYGYLGGMLEGLFGGYINKEIDLKNTNKQFLSDTNEYGVAGAINEHRQTDRTAEENAEIDDTRERILIAAGHTPNPGNMNIANDSSDIEMTTRKPFENSAAARNNGNVGMIYQSSPFIDTCGITKIPDKNNAYSNRLDASLLESINENDFMKTQRINPIKSNVKL
jgi:hypothetical protein